MTQNILRYLERADRWIFLFFKIIFWLAIMCLCLWGGHIKCGRGSWTIYEITLNGLLP